MCVHVMSHDVQPLVGFVSSPFSFPTPHLHHLPRPCFQTPWKGWLAVQKREIKRKRRIPAAYRNYKGPRSRPSKRKKKNPPFCQPNRWKKKKDPTWTVVVPKTTTPTLRKPLQARNSGLKKEKKIPEKVSGELIMMLAKRFRIIRRGHRAGTFVYLEKCRAIDVTTSFITAQRS